MLAAFHLRLADHVQPIRLAIAGSNGRMGRCAAGVAAWRRALRAGRADRVTRRTGTTRRSCDVVVDFSTPAGFDAALAHCRKHGIALVSGTTGSGRCTARRAAGRGARDSPCSHAANFSLGIAVLTRLLREAAAALPDWQLEIVEAHHARKLDAPSGTALALGRAAAQARGQDFDQVAQFARHGHTGVRVGKAIGFASIRAGEIVGEHTALLAGADERIELTHRAYDNTIFARGALQAAQWLAGKPAGLYSIKDVIDAAH